MFDQEGGYTQAVECRGDHKRGPVARPALVGVETPGEQFTRLGGVVPQRRPVKGGSRRQAHVFRGIGRQRDSQGIRSGVSRLSLRGDPADCETRPKNSDFHDAQHGRNCTPFVGERKRARFLG